MKTTIFLVASFGMAVAVAAGTGEGRAGGKQGTRAERGERGGRGGHGERGARLKALDTDSDGKLSRAEFLAGGGERIARLDRDGDGNVTRAEVEAIEREGVRERVLAKFDEADKDGDGVISAAEREAGRAAHFDKLDKNGDGVLDPSDRKQTDDKHHGENGGELGPSENNTDI